MGKLKVSGRVASLSFDQFWQARKAEYTRAVDVVLDGGVGTAAPSIRARMLSVRARFSVCTPGMRGVTPLRLLSGVSAHS